MKKSSFVAFFVILSIALSSCGSAPANRAAASLSAEVAALLNSGNAHLSRSEYDRAISDFTAALRLEPGNIHARDALAFAEAARARQLRYAPEDPFFTGDGGYGMVLAILEPRSSGLSQDELRWMPSLVQGAMTGDFNLHSAMTITDRQNLDVIIAEQDLSMSGLFSDEDFISIGNLVHAQYVVSGSITRTPTVFMLEFAVTNVETGERRASTRPIPASLQDMENLSAVRNATADLLGQLGVNLTAHGRLQLTSPLAIPTLQAQTALAMGITAQREGLEVEAMSYFLQASGRAPELAEATDRLDILTTGLVNAGLGMDAQQYAVWREQWMGRLLETEDLFASQTQRQPYFLVYDMDSMRRGATNQRDGTVDLGFWMSLVPDPVWADTINQMMYTVAGILMATGRVGAWDLDWPNNAISETSPFDDLPNYITAVVEIVNEHGVSIGSQTVTIPAGFSVQPGAIRSIVPRQWEGDVVFEAVDANLVTENLGVQVASVDDDAGRTAVSVMSNTELYRTFGIRSAPVETPIFAVQEREPSNQPRFSLGLGVGFDGGGIGSVSGDWSGWDGMGSFSEEIRFNGFGAWFLMDWVIAELSIGMFGGSALVNWSFEESWWDDRGTFWDSGSGTEEGSFFALDIGLLGKIPIAVGGGRHFIFPAIGLGYTAVLSVEFDGYYWDTPGDFNTFRIMGGMGVDFGLTQGIFLRTSVLGIYRFAASIFNEDWWGPSTNTRGAFGVNVRVGLGFSL